MFRSKTVVAICVVIALIMGILIWIQMTGALAVFFDPEPEEDYPSTVSRVLDLRQGA
jgi:hypothetical protein